jgi:hypothetical protein
MHVDPILQRYPTDGIMIIHVHVYVIKMEMILFHNDDECFSFLYVSWELLTKLSMSNLFLFFFTRKLDQLEQVTSHTACVEICDFTLKLVGCQLVSIL